jgi:hypothetical protein
MQTQNPKVSPVDISPLELEGMACTATTIQIPKDLSPERVEAALARLGAVERGTPWWIGDLLVFAGKRYGETYDAAQRATGYGTATLKNFAWVSRKCAPARRRSDLPWSAHRVVATLAPKEQTRWLARAAAEKWTSSELARALNDDDAMSVAPECAYTEAQCSNLGLVPYAGAEPVDPAEHWVGLPEYAPADKPFRIIVSCREEAERDEFMRTIGSPTIHGKNDRTWSVWYPSRPKDDVKSVRFVEVDGE